MDTADAAAGAGVALLAEAVEAVGAEAEADMLKREGLWNAEVECLRSSLWTRCSQAGGQEVARKMARLAEDGE